MQHRLIRRLSIQTLQVRPANSKLENSLKSQESNWARASEEHAIAASPKPECTR